MSGKETSPKFDRAKVERILALSLELTNLELSTLIKKLTEMSNERVHTYRKNGTDNTDTIHT